MLWIAPLPVFSGILKLSLSDYWLSFSLCCVLNSFIPLDLYHHLNLILKNPSSTHSHLLFTARLSKHSVSTVYLLLMSQHALIWILPLPLYWWHLLRPPLTAGEYSHWTLFSTHLAWSFSSIWSVDHILLLETPFGHHNIVLSSFSSKFSGNSFIVPSTGIPQGFSLGPLLILYSISYTSSHHTHFHDFN